MTTSKIPPTSQTVDDISDRLIMLKLINGDQLVALVVRETEDLLLIKHPLAIRLKTETDGTLTLQFVAWMILAETNTYPIQKNHILTMACPSAEAKADYVKYVTQFNNQKTSAKKASAKKNSSLNWLTDLQSELKKESDKLDDNV